MAFSAYTAYYVTLSVKPKCLVYSVQLLQTIGILGSEIKGGEPLEACQNQPNFERGLNGGVN